jgi:hypothetical protein
MQLIDQFLALFRMVIEMVRLHVCPVHSTFQRQANKSYDGCSPSYPVEIALSAQQAPRRTPVVVADRLQLTFAALSKSMDLVRSLLAKVCSHLHAMARC